MVAQAEKGRAHVSWPPLAPKMAAAEASRVVHFRREQDNARRLGITWYQWSTCRDQCVRPSHQNLDGVLVPWDDPPRAEWLVGEPSLGPFHAGEAPGCRCVPLSLLVLDDVSWPARVYYDGTIKQMSRRQFVRLGWKEPGA